MSRREPKHLGPRRRPAPIAHRPQFDPEGSLKTRHVERTLLNNRFAHDFLHCIAMAGLTAMLYPRFVAPYRWKFTRYDMAFPNLPAKFAGYKILQLTDLHMGRTKVSYVQSVVRRCLEEKPDLIVITGDLIHYHPDGLADLPQILKLLHAKDGVLAVFGNHDYHEYSWRHVGKRSAQRSIQKRLVSLVQDCGVELLRNELHTIGRSGAQLQLVGMDELWAGNFDPVAAFARVDPAQPCICLQHNPDGCASLQSYPWQWMLCGHSHGGQLDLPVLGPMYVPQEHRHWLRGFFHFPESSGGAVTGGKTMFVSTGIGHSAPVRMRVPPEATLFTLRRA